MIFLTDTLTDRMGVQPIWSVEVSLIIGKMLNFDGDVKCKQTLRISAVYSSETLCFMMYEIVLRVNESFCFVHQRCVVSHCRLA